MKFLVSVTCFLFVSQGAFAENPFLNLDFEDGQPGSTPRSWYAGGEGYSGMISTDDPHSGEQCLQLKKVDPESHGFGVGTNSFPLEVAAGHKLRFTGWIRTAAVTQGFAGLWWRADGKDGVLAFDNMQTRGVTGDTEWTEYTIELAIPAEITNINFGCILPGNGTAWFDDLQVELAGKVYQQVRPEPFLATETQVSWLAETAHTFATDDPSHENEDLVFLKEMVGDAHIVALGEGTHGTAEFFRMKHRIIRYLAEEMGFTLFGIEASMPEAELLNDYVLNGEGNPATLIAGMYFWTWRTDEVLALVKWMRQFNAEGGHLEFHGIDMQYPGLAMKTVLDGVENSAPDLMATADATYAKLRRVAQSARKEGQGRVVVSKDLLAATTSIHEELISRRDEIKQAGVDGNLDWIIQNALLIKQYCQMTGGDFGARDRSMAANADWLLEAAAPGAKIVLWAHNGHVSRVGHSGGKAMGTYLDQRHGSDMVVFGFFFHEGKYTAVKRGESGWTWGTSDSAVGSVEWAFHRVGKPRLVLDLRQAIPGSESSGWVHEILEYRSIGSMALDHAFHPGIMADHFDALVFFETSTPSMLLNVWPPSPWAMWE